MFKAKQFVSRIQLYSDSAQSNILTNWFFAFLFLSKLKNPPFSDIDERKGSENNNFISVYICTIYLVNVIIKRAVNNN